MPAREVRGGQTGSFALKLKAGKDGKKTKKRHVRKGMVLLGAGLVAKAVWEFDAVVVVLHHPSTIVPLYQAMVHIGSIRQASTHTHTHTHTPSWRAPFGQILVLCAVPHVRPLPNVLAGVCARSRQGVALTCPCSLC